MLITGLLLVGFSSLAICYDLAVLHRQRYGAASRTAAEPTLNPTLKRS